MHWNTNLKYSIRKFDVEALELPDSVKFEVERYINDNVVANASDYNNPKIFRSKVDTETSLGFDELKDSLLRSSEYELKRPEVRNCGLGILFRAVLPILILCRSESRT